MQGPYAALSGLLTVYNDAKYSPSKVLTLTFLKAPSIIGDFAMRFGSYGNTGFTDTANRIIYSWKLEKTAGTYRVASYVFYRFPNPKP